MLSPEGARLDSPGWSPGEPVHAAWLQAPTGRYSPARGVDVAPFQGCKGEGNSVSQNFALGYRVAPLRGFRGRHMASISSKVRPLVSGTMVTTKTTLNRLNTA